MPYAELHAHSFFSLLDGASSPEALVARAKALGLRALALTDHDSLAGAVRFWTAAQKEGLPAIIGAELSLDDDSHLTLLAETPRGYANLCRLITRGHGAAGTSTEDWPGKTPPQTPWADVAARHEGLIALSGCAR
ncbi:MAG TPA: PHP domain-containing protein, partial [Thermoflexales bacterium]|nr:PHP domain-containing protein [Thermoflexales bacterium]